jgi:hypothetical protein
MCKSQLIECPIVEKNCYTMKAQLLMCKTDSIGEANSFTDTVNYLTYLNVSIF